MCLGNNICLWIIQYTTLKSFLARKGGVDEALGFFCRDMEDFDYRSFIGKDLDLRKELEEILWELANVSRPERIRSG